MPDCEDSGVNVKKLVLTDHSSSKEISLTLLCLFTVHNSCDAMSVAAR